MNGIDSALYIKHQIGNTSTGCFMNTKKKSKASGLCTPKEFALLENIAFGSKILRAAFLFRDELCMEWVSRRSRDLAMAQSPQAAKAVVEAIAKERVGQIARLDHMDEAGGARSARARERALSIEAQKRRAHGSPSLFDRRSGEWTTASYWRPVAGVDAPTGPLFHEALESRDFA